MSTSRRPKPPLPANSSIVVDGRRWRTSDPGIPPSFRQELVNELMAARRGVRDAASDHELRQSRRRVNDTKVALGERGHPWWLPPTPAALTKRVEATIVALLRSRGPGTTICPSDVARIVGGSAWRSRLPLVRERAVKMRERGQLEILRRKRLIRTKLTSGVLRYRLRPMSRRRG